MLILEIFLKVVLGGGGVDFCWWWRVLPVGGGGGLCLGMVVAGCTVYGGVLLRFLDLEFVGGPVIVVVVCGNGCSSGCCGGGCSGGSWFLVGGDCRGSVFAVAEPGI